MSYMGALLYLDRDVPCHPNLPSVETSTSVAQRHMLVDSMTGAFESGRVWGKTAAAFKMATGHNLLPSPRSRWKWRR